jgi:hypothetical protein
VEGVAWLFLCGDLHILVRVAFLRITTLGSGVWGVAFCAVLWPDD